MLSPAALDKWRTETPNMNWMVPDYHRLQLEHFIWQQSLKIQGSVLEVGAEQKRPYLSHLHYVTVNCEDPSDADRFNEVRPGAGSPDIYGDILSLPFCAERFDCIIATETFEHVSDPVGAIRECYRVLRPGGVALFTTPFMWPYHGQSRYPDYWRFTADGWRLLCKDFASVRVYPTEFIPDSHITAVRVEERMGNADEVRMATGYLVKALKE